MPYDNAPPNQMAALQQFRKEHPERTETVNGTYWTYIDTFTEKPPLLILVGGLRVADAAFNAITILERDFRCIVPTYPALDDIAELADGVDMLLFALGLSQVDVLAGSFGGMLAQVLAHRHPAHVRKLVLSSTGIPDASTYKQTARLLSLAPASLANQQAKKRMLDIIAPPPDQHEFWKAYLEELYGKRIGKRETLSTLHCIIDFAENYGDLTAWDGAVLLLGAADDTTFGPDTQAAIQARFPQAQRHTFERGGHSPSMTQPEAYFGVVREFLLAD